MKKTYRLRLLTSVLAALFIASFCGSPSASATGVTFFAVDETLLDLGYGSTSYGGEIYISPGVFSNVSGIYTAYSSSQKLITLYNSSGTLVFDLSEGTCYTVGGPAHSTCAILRGGSPYVPINFVCSYFGLSYSYLTTEVAPLIRLKTGSEVLSDSTFISAVSSTMSTKYFSYVEKHPELFSSPVTIGLLLTGSLGEDTINLLDYFSSTGIRAVFFTDAESIRSHPEIVQQIYCQGHSVGVMCEDIESATMFNDALNDVLSSKTRLALGPASLSEEGYAILKYDIDATNIGISTTVGRVANAISKFSGKTAVVRMNVDEMTAEYISQITRSLNQYYYWSLADETLAA